MVDDVEIHPEIITDYIQAAMMKYCIKGIAIDDFRYALLAAALREIGFDAKVYKNLKLVRPSDIMRVATVIDSCFANDNFIWGDNPVLRWGTNNTKMIPYGRKPGKKDDADIGNYVYGKIEAKSRKTDPFMALVASMTIEDMIPYGICKRRSNSGLFVILSLFCLCAYSFRTNCRNNTQVLPGLLSFLYTDKYCRRCKSPGLQCLCLFLRFRSSSARRIHSGFPPSGSLSK